METNYRYSHLNTITDNLNPQRLVGIKSNKVSLEMQFFTCMFCEKRCYAASTHRAAGNKKQTLSINSE